MDEFINAISECNLLHSIEIRSLTQGGTTDLGEQIEQARERREQAKDALFVHLEVHGC